MLATNNAKSNEAIKSFLSRQKEIYRTPYERYPKDRPRQCVFAGTTNKSSFLPSDRTGNRRFLPIACKESEAEVFILDNEAESRAYIRQMWAEVMTIWRSGKVRLKLSPEMTAEVRRRQKQFMQEDVDAGLILDFMLDFDGDKKAAECGNALAMSNLGFCYLYGKGTEVDEAAAFKMFSKAALWDVGDAIIRLGDMYQYGKNVEKDGKTAWMLYQKACTLAEADLSDWGNQQVYSDVSRRLGDCNYYGPNGGKDLIFGGIHRQCTIMK